MQRVFALSLAFLLTACAGSETPPPAQPERVMAPPIQTKPENHAIPVRAAPRAQAPLQGYSKYKVGRPYKIRGRRYTPVAKFDHTETGRASWYGPNFHGKQTANGEPFDKYAMTAAHRTLQLPSIIRVTNVGNGRQVVLRVNDRGPYHGNRILDVSEVAAEALGFKHLGTARVRIEVLRGPSEEVKVRAKDGASVAELERVRAEAERHYLGDGEQQLASLGASVGMEGPSSERIFIQAGAFSDASNALKFAQRFRDMGKSEVHRTDNGGSRVYRVWVGPFVNEQAAREALPLAMARGAPGAHIVATQ